jgi:hypothetical protein
VPPAAPASRCSAWTSARPSTRERRAGGSAAPCGWRGRGTPPPRRAPRRSSAPSRRRRGRGAAEPVLVPAARYYGPVPSGASETLAAADAYRGAELRKGYARLIGRVVDDASDLPLDDACLAYRRGSLVIRARSDRSGFFAIDLPRAPGSVELLFGRAGYAPARASLASWGANDITFFFDVRLTPR